MKIYIVLTLVILSFSIQAQSLDSIEEDQAIRNLAMKEAISLDVKLCIQDSEKENIKNDLTGMGYKDLDLDRFSCQNALDKALKYGFKPHEILALALEAKREAKVNDTNRDQIKDGLNSDLIDLKIGHIVNQL